MTDPLRIEDLPPPRDDGAAAHLPGSRMPAIELPSTDGLSIRLSDLEERTVLFVFPSIGGIDDARLEEWTAIPGARGCTQEACDFRDRLHVFEPAGADVLGLSGQSLDELGNAIERLRLPYPLLSDEGLSLATSLRLPTFEFRGSRYFKRITLITSEGRVEAALYPVFPPDQAAEQALTWLAENRSER
jgi:peroxiredoxin